MAKKNLDKENKQKALKTVSDQAEAAVSEGKSFCISRVYVGLDAPAAREAVKKVVERKVCGRY